MPHRLHELSAVYQRAQYQCPAVNQQRLERCENHTVNQQRQQSYESSTVNQRSQQCYNESHTVNHQRQRYESAAVNQQRHGPESATVNHQRQRYESAAVNQRRHGPESATVNHQRQRYESATVNQQRHGNESARVNQQRQRYESATVSQRRHGNEIATVNQQRHGHESARVNQQRQRYESATVNQQRQGYESATFGQQPLQHRTVSSYEAECTRQAEKTGLKDRAHSYTRLSNSTSVCSPTQRRHEQGQSHRVAGRVQENSSWQDSWETSRNNDGTAFPNAAYNHNLALSELAGVAGVYHKLKDDCSNHSPKQRGERSGDVDVSHWNPAAPFDRVILLQTPQIKRHNFKSKSPPCSHYNIAPWAFTDIDSQSPTDGNICTSRDRIVSKVDNHSGDHSCTLSVDSASRLPGSGTGALQMSRPSETNAQPAIFVWPGDKCSNTDPEFHTGHFTADTLRSARTSNPSEKTRHPDNRTTHKPNYTNAKLDLGQPFTCKSGHDLVDKSMWRRPEHSKAEGSSSVREVDHKKTKTTRLAMIVLLVLLVVAVAVMSGVLSVALGTNPGTASMDGGSNTSVVRAIVTLKILNRQFDDQLSAFDSEAFRNLADPFSLELGRLFLQSNLAHIYRHNEIVSFRNGSIYAKSAMTFVDAGLISSPQDIENVIETAEVAADWNSGDALKLGQFVVCRSCTDTQVDFVSSGQLPRVTQEKSEISTDSSPTTPVYRNSAPTTENFKSSLPMATASTILNFSRAPTETVDSTPVLTAAETSSTTTTTRSTTTITSQLTNSATSSHSTVAGPSTVARPETVPTSAQPTVTFQPRNGFVAEGLTGLVCSLRDVSDWSEIVIGRAGASTDSEDVLTVTRNGTVTWYDASLRKRAIANLHLGSDSDVLEVWVYVLKCADAGNYTCAVRGPTPFHNAHAQLIVYVHPESPTLTVPGSVVEGHDQTVEITCEARLGVPAAALTLKMKPPHQQTFEAVNFTDAPAETTGGCTAPVSRSYVMPASKMVNQTVFRCEVTSSSEIHKHVQLASDEKRLFVLSATVCQGAGSTLLLHPGDCRLFIQCLQSEVTVPSEVSVLSCSPGLCFNVRTQQCDIVTATSSPYVKDDTCSTDSNSTFLPHPSLCDKYIQCMMGRQVIQHCPQGHVYANYGLCTSEIRKAWCYKA
ncbi:hypothetical protein BsWGS_03592 [Bradybaena similaris]